MSKGVAIPYIIALVIGLVVLVVVIYWVYKASSSTVFDLQRCKSIIIDICSMCLNTKWDENYKLSSNLRNIMKECAKKYSELYYFEDNECCGSSCCGPGTCGAMKWDCEEAFL